MDWINLAQDRDQWRDSMKKATDIEFVVRTVWLWRVVSFGMKLRVVRWSKPSRKGALLATCFKLVSRMAYHSALKKQATCSSETSFDFQRTSQRHIPEDMTLFYGTAYLRSMNTLECFQFLGYFWLLSKDSGGSEVGWNTMLQAGRSRVQIPIRSLHFSIDLIFPAALWPWDRLSL
jgi:hypothetical protein